MMKVASLLSVSLLALVTLACGDDEDEGGGSGKPTAAEFARGEGCPDESGMMPTADCDTSSYAGCVEAQCAADHEACLGTGYKNGNFSGGACAEFMQCALSSADPCTATNCTPSEECTSCMLELANCVLGTPCQPPECAGGAPGEPSPMPGGGGGGCTALMDCCAGLTGEQQTDCNDTLDSLMGNDMVCDATLGIYQAAGTCP